MAMRLALLCVCAASLALVVAQSPSTESPSVLTTPSAPIVGFRPPAVPLIVFSPYNSIWSTSDNLTDTFTTFWGGRISCLTGLIRIDGTVYRWMSGVGLGIAPMQQTNVVVWPLRTIYTFVQAGVELTVTFVTPAFPEDIKELSKPITHINMAVRSVDGVNHFVALYYDHTAEVAIMDTNELVTWDVVDSSQLRIARIGSSAQRVLGAKGDNQKINWGWAYAATDFTNSSFTIADTTLARAAFRTRVPLPALDKRKPRQCDDHWPGVAMTWDLGSVGPTPSSARLIFAYDEIKSMMWFGQALAPYWNQLYPSAREMIETLYADFPVLLSKAATYDVAFYSKVEQTPGAGPALATMTALGFRQVTGATAVVLSPNSVTTLWYFMKEISSAGDISTVDVIYPASPFFLLLAPEQLRLSLLPILAYGNNETNIAYNLTWAPHHLGTWPICDLKPMDQEQMPMEETGNLYLMLAAIAQEQAWNVAYLKPYLPVMKVWADALVAGLPDPGDQLCTDDFEGPSPHNVNLAAKGIVGLAAYSLLLNASGDAAGAALAMNTAKGFVNQWIVAAHAHDHYKIQYNLDHTTWSLKYNLIFQKILSLDLFPQHVFDTELAYYKTKLNQYGVPLDNRAIFTKTDWLSWVAALSPSAEYSMVLYGSIVNSLTVTKSRVPFTDWYRTDNAQQQGFQARPVIGGIFAHLLLH